MNPHDGYIKYQQHWEETSEIFVPLRLIEMRNKLASLGWIGVYPDGVGFGNISMRADTAHSFIISGTQTGHIKVADASHFCLVEKADTQQNTLWCSGPVKASSEALTHAAFYAVSYKIKVVIHIHHPAAWKMALHQIPTTDVSVEYGTPQMAKAVSDLFMQYPDNFPGVIATAGHQDGLFAFGETMDDAFKVLSEVVQRSSTNNG